MLYAHNSVLRLNIIMPSISLDILSNVNATKNNANVFSDLKLDLALDSTYNNQLYKQQQILDLQADTNLGAIYNSITNILTTTPGQKPLNPLFGIGFGNILFLPVSEQRALSIGNAIFQAIQNYEPRITITNINVEPREDDNQYIITLNITVPRFSTQQVRIVGTLDKSGFFINN
jgi:phage baseplate assembly protein W